jgi:hypothetical protein
MNRISLYEAIRRKKESQGLNNTAPKAAPVSDQTQRPEPRAQLKQPAVQEKPAIQAKQAVKYPLIRPLSSKRGLLRKPPKDFWLKWSWILGFIKKNPMSAKIGIGGLIVVVVLIVFFNLYKPQPDSEKPVQPVVAVKNNPLPVTIVEKKTPEPKPAVIKQEEKPAPPVQPPVAAVPVKQVEAAKPKPEPKAQIPAAIQSQLQKQAESVKSPPPKPTGKGDHIIVIAAYTKQEDLNPVGAYFRQNGIETEFIKQGSYYLLVTKERFEYPEQSGKMVQTIKRIGANYKAPSGYERFSSTPFQDAYGKKVK